MILLAIAIGKPGSFGDNFAELERLKNEYKSTLTPI